MILSTIAFALPVILGIICLWHPNQKQLIILFTILTIFANAVLIYRQRNNDPPNRLEFKQELDNQAVAITKDVIDAFQNLHNPPEINRINEIAEKYNVTTDELLNYFELGSPVQRGIHAVLNKQYDEAVSILTQNRMNVEEDMAANYYFLGQAYFALKKYDKAIDSFKKTLVLFPNHCLSLTVWGTILTKQRKFDEAIAKHKAAINKNPDCWQAISNLGYTYTMINKNDMAYNEFLKANTIRPNNPAILLNLGVALGSLGKHESAKKYYKQVIEIDPLNSQVHVLIGNDKNLSEATKYYKKAIKFDPNNAMAFYNWGTKLFNVVQEKLHIGELIKKGDERLKILNDAESKLRKAVELDPFLPEALHNLGAVLNIKGEWEEAKTTLHRALSLSPNNAAINYSLGEAYRLLNIHEKAKKYYKKAIDLNVRYNIGADCPARYYEEFFLYHGKPKTTSPE